MFNLPKEYLSYSAYSLWKSDKDRFRNKYYLGKDDFQTSETVFGKAIAKHLEDGNKIEGVQDYEKSEKKIQIKLEEGLKLLGYLDGFNETDLSIVELKTGHLDKNGKAPWNNLKVRKHVQLVFYCLLVKYKYGKYNPKVTLQWLETDFKKTTHQVGDHIFESKTNKLDLTGKIETFVRIVEDWEIDKLKEDILLVAKEISDDYTLWQNTTK